MTALEVLKMAFDCGIDIKVQGDNLHLNAKQAPSNQLLAELKQHKSELLLLLAANDPHPKGEAKTVIQKTVRLVEPPQHTATDSPLTTNELLRHYEKPLFNHLLACDYCHVVKAQYCLNGYAMGSVYDALLLCRDDAQDKRKNLALRVDRAKIKGGFR